jgi:hypothetical protein
METQNVTGKFFKNNLDSKNVTIQRESEHVQTYSLHKIRAGIGLCG